MIKNAHRVDTKSQPGRQRRIIAVTIISRRGKVVKMKVKFVSTEGAMSGVLKGKLANAAELVGNALGRSAEAGVAALMIKEGGMIGVMIVGALAIVKIAIEADGREPWKT